MNHSRNRQHKINIAILLAILLPSSQEFFIKTFISVKNKKWKYISKTNVFLLRFYFRLKGLKRIAAVEEDCSLEFRSYSRPLIKIEICNRIFNTARKVIWSAELIQCCSRDKIPHSTFWQWPIYFQQRMFGCGIRGRGIDTSYRVCNRISRG